MCDRFLSPRGNREQTRDSAPPRKDVAHASDWLKDRRPSLPLLQLSCRSRAETKPAPKQHAKVRSWDRLRPPSPADLGQPELHKFAISLVLPHTIEWPPGWPRWKPPLATPLLWRHRRFPTSGASWRHSALPAQEDWTRFHPAKSPLWFRPPWRLANAHRPGSSPRCRFRCRGTNRARRCPRPDACGFFAMYRGCSYQRRAEKDPSSCARHLRSKPRAAVARRRVVHPASLTAPSKSRLRYPSLKDS